MVLERGVFPVPKDLKKSPLAPLMNYRHPLYSESPFNPYRYWLNAPSELQEWVRCNATKEIDTPALGPHDKQTVTEPSSNLLPRAGAFGEADLETDTESSTDSGDEVEAPTPRTPQPAEFDDACEDDVEIGDEVHKSL